MLKLPLTLLIRYIYQNGTALDVHRHRLPSFSDLTRLSIPRSKKGKLRTVPSQLLQRAY